jgi:hypothetical protein
MIRASYDGNLVGDVPAMSAAFGANECSTHHRLGVRPYVEHAWQLVGLHLMLLTAEDRMTC